MENNGNQDLSSALCQNGCGFFGTTQFDGMCSKCYKSTVKRKQAAPSDSNTSAVRAANPLIAQSNSSSEVSFMSTNTVTSSSSASTIPDTTPSIRTASPTVPIFNQPSDSAPSLGAVVADLASSPATSGTDGEGSGVDSPSKTKKRNRCYSCKKKVGLTGFECRCGGLFCSVHRYSDKHSCEFDYKEHGAEFIRKHNPVVVSEKVQKI